MNDLERLWDELPVGPAPVAAIMRSEPVALPSARRRVLRTNGRGAGDREPGIEGSLNPRQRAGMLSWVTGRCQRIRRQDRRRGPPPLRN